MPRITQPVMIRVPTLRRTSQPLRLAQFESAIFTFPGVDCGFADAVFTGQIRHLAACLVLLQNADDLLFAESALLHLWILLRRLPPTLRSTILRGRVYRGHIPATSFTFRCHSDLAPGNWS